MPAPLLAVDAPSLLYRAFFALPTTITDDEGRPVNALLGSANLVLWAVDATVSGLELHTIGWILLAVGAIGALLSLIFWSSWGGIGGPDRRRDVVRDY